LISPVLTGLAGACCCGVGVRGIVLMRSPSAVERRELRELRAELEHAGPRRGPVRRLVGVLGAWLGPVLLARMSARRREAVARKIDLAGRPGGLDLERYAELKAAIVALASLLAALLLTGGTWILAVPALGLGWLGVDIWLSRAGRIRQAHLERELPDFIDILAITVRAGTGYRAALDRVASSLSGPPAEELARTLRQMELGATRREAFESLRARNSSKTLDNFVAAQLQAEELGVPLADALASIASDTRRTAAQSARRRAQRAAPRISLIAATMLLPATMILIAVGLFIGSGFQTLGIFG
jgi:tight adherence protein C